MSNKQLKDLVDKNGQLNEAGITFVRSQLSSIIKEAREETDLSCYAVSVLTGITVPTAMKIETGESNFNIDNLIKYLSGINCSIQIIKNE